MAGKRSKRLRPRTPLCPECRINRPFHGGPCPPCLRRLGKQSPEPPTAPRIIESALTYQQRNEYLESLGFDSYRRYLNSSLWQSIRHKVFEGGRRCWICRRLKKALQVHHERYTKSNLSGESTAGLRPICRACHFIIEFDTNTGKKRDERQTRKTTHELRKRPPGVKKRKARRLEKAMRRLAKLDRGMEAELDRLLARDG